MARLIDGNNNVITDTNKMKTPIEKGMKHLDKNTDNDYYLGEIKKAMKIVAEETRKQTAKEIFNDIKKIMKEDYIDSWLEDIEQIHLRNKKPKKIK